MKSIKKKKLSRLIHVKYHDAEMPRIERIDGTKSDWIDLRNADEIDIKAGEWVQVSLGISVKLPKHYEAIVAPRSSTFKKYGLLLPHSIGIIDNSYNGNDDVWQAIFYATRDIHIDKYTRLLQFRIIQNMPRIKIIEVDEILNTKNRGGIGSTGEK